MSDDLKMSAQSQNKQASTVKDGYVSFGHPSVTLKLPSGQFVEIDEGVLDLIKLMNTIPGIETKGSCQGQDATYGYVQFMPDDTSGKAHASVYFMYHILKNMHGAWVMHRHRMGEHQQSTGSEHPDAYKFKFTTELGNGYVLKWSPYTYPAVLAAAHKAAEETMQDT
ncbi:hypothetical protein [Granulicella arctica]|uniref:hypothetical protein n=1 Tax=Granulicella arctica TaxID=940613 RepID=UPI0021DFB2FF|nr:hypothetical protein [Granulicella arctica]